MTIARNAPNSGKTYTSEEFENLPEFSQRYELVKGKLVEKPVAGDEHGRIIQRINRKITLFDPDEKLGQVWTSDTNFNVGTGWMPMPDLGFMIASRVPPVSKKSVNGVPDLVVEVHSPIDLRSQVEREAATQKIRDWQAVGVRILWVVNPDNRTVEVYHPDEPAPVRTLTEAEVLDGEDVIPGFSLKVGDLFR